MRPLIIALALLGTVSCASRRPHAESDPTEWLPTIGSPASLEDWERQAILNKCGLGDAKTIWFRCLDLDRDGKEDCVVTIALPTIPVE